VLFDPTNLRQQENDGSHHRDYCDERGIALARCRSGSTLANPAEISRSVLGSSVFEGKEIA